VRALLQLAGWLMIVYVSMAGEKGVPEALMKLGSLTSLNLAGVGMLQLPADFFAALPHLQVIDLSRNQLVTLPGEIARATALRSLNISHNPFNRLPNAILHLVSLEEFYAWYVRTRPLDSSKLINHALAHSNVAAEQCLRLADLGAMTRLRCLDLHDNGITALPPGCFARWANMERLWLSRNQLSELPVEVGCLARTLRELHLDHNRIDRVPTELAKLTCLRVLTLAANLIVELPAQLGVLTQLERLEVGSQNGRLRYIPLRPTHLLSS
jgi:Leucine-rich repeat (LRR) protein